MKGIATLLFGLVLMMFAVASAVLNLVAGDNLFAYLFMGFSALAFIVSVAGLVLVFVRSGKEKKNSSGEERK